MDDDLKPPRPSRSRKGFQIFYIDAFTQKECLNMYAKIMKGKFMDFEVDIKFLTQSIVRGSIATYKAIVEHFRDANDEPKLSNTFYSSDIKKVICGVLRSHKDCHDTKFEVVQLWVYEVFRTFRDRMVEEEAENSVIEIVRAETKKAFNMNFDSVCEDEEELEPPLFGNILDTYGFYTDIDEDELAEYLPKKLEEYNSSGQYPKMDIIFNKRAVQHIIRTLRVISEPGSKLLFTYKKSYKVSSFTIKSTIFSFFVIAYSFMYVYL